MNDNKDIFDLTRKEEPLLSSVVPQARQQMCLDTRICEAARMFFCFLTDASLQPGTKTRNGVVKFSDSYLAARFRVASKTIRNWKRAIESTGRVWLTEKFMKNSFPQTVYNITAIVGHPALPASADSDDGSLSEDEIWSSNRRRQRAAKHDPTTGRFAAVSVILRPPSPPLDEPVLEISQNAEQIAPCGNGLPPPTATICRPPRQTVAAHRGNPLPSATATICRPPRQTVAAPDGNHLPWPTATICRRERKTVADNGESQIRELSVLKGGEEHPPPRYGF